MKPIAALVLSIVSLVPAVALAGANCWTITDPDQRAYCRAVASKSAGDCSFISDHSLKQTCRARVSSNPSSCNTVSSEWERQECKRQAAKR